MYLESHEQQISVSQIFKKNINRIVIHFQGRRNEITTAGARANTVQPKKPEKMDFYGMVL